MISFRAGNPKENNSEYLMAKGKGENTKANVRSHVNNGSKGKSPYLSFSTEITTIVFKYCYGIKTDQKGDKIKFNKTRPNIYLLNIDEESFERASFEGIENGIEIKPKENKSVYFTTEDLQEILKGANSACNYVNADKEVLVYEKVKKENLKEVHPILADILVGLKSLQTSSENIDENTRNLLKEFYNEIVEKIVSGDCSVENITKFLQENELGLNDIEKNFVNEFYVKKNNIIGSFKESTKDIYTMVNGEKKLISKEIFKLEDDDMENIVTSELDMALGVATALRVEIIKKILPKFLEKEEIGNKDRIKEVIEKFKLHYKLVTEETVRTTNKQDKKIFANIALDGNKDRQIYYYKGMEYIKNDDGKIVGFEVKRFQKDIKGYSKSAQMCIPPLKDIPKPTGKGYFSDDPNNKYALKVRGLDFRSFEFQLFRNKDGYVFDNEGYCLKLSSYGIEGFVFEEDENGNKVRSKYTPAGKDKDGLERGKINEYGFTKKITVNDFKDKSIEELGKIILDSHQEYVAGVKNIEGENKKNTPLLRLIKIIAENEVKNIESNIKKIGKFDKEKFYKGIFKNFFSENDLEELNDQKILDKFKELIVNIKNIALENDIDVEKIYKEERKKFFEKRSLKSDCFRKIDGNIYSFDENGYCVKFNFTKERWFGIDYMKIIEIEECLDKNDEKTKYDPEGFDVNGYNKDGYNKEGINKDGLCIGETRRSGMPSKISFENFKNMSKEELKEILLEAEKEYQKSNESIKPVIDNSPVVRLLKSIINATLNSMYIEPMFFIEKINNKEEKVYKDVIENNYEDRIKRKLYKKIFEFKENREITDEDSEKMSEFIKLVFEMLNEKKIDIEEIIKNAMTNFIEKINDKIDEAWEYIGKVQKNNKETDSKETDSLVEKLYEIEEYFGVNGELDDNSTFGTLAKTFLNRFNNGLNDDEGR